MRFIVDWQGRPVRLTAERLDHIRQHPEMIRLESVIEETLRSPACVVQSRSDSAALLHYRVVVGTPVGDKLLCVVVKGGRDGAFVFTAYLTDTVRKGRLIWPVAS
jgi:hypothetical protein